MKRFQLAILYCLMIFFCTDVSAHVYVSGINSGGNFTINWTNTSYNTCSIPPSPGSSQPRLQTINSYIVKEWFNGGFLGQYIVKDSSPTPGSYNPPKYKSFSNKETGEYLYEVTVTNCSSSGQTSYVAGTTTINYIVSNQSRSGKPVVFIHTDMLGNPVAETDEQGNVIQ